MERYSGRGRHTAQKMPPLAGEPAERGVGVTKQRGPFMAQRGEGYAAAEKYIRSGPMEAWLTGCRG